MATTTTTLRLGTSGIVGVTEFVAAQVTGDITATSGTAYAVTGNATDSSTDITITLPMTPRQGDFIVIKNLIPDQADTANNAVLTIDRNSHLLDMRTDNITSSTRLERWELVYINATVGWLIL